MTSGGSLSLLASKKCVGPESEIQTPPRVIFEEGVQPESTMCTNAFKHGNQSPRMQS